MSRNESRNRQRWPRLREVRPAGIPETLRSRVVDPGATIRPSGRLGHTDHQIQRTADGHTETDAADDVQRVVRADVDAGEPHQRDDDPRHDSPATRQVRDDDHGQGGDQHQLISGSRGPEGGRSVHRLHVVGLIAVVCAALCACSDGGSTRVESALGDDAITVGSFDFAESLVLAEVYSQALEAVGFAVVRAFDLGPREFVAPALQRGLIELVPEYAGTATTFLSLGRTAPGHDVGADPRELDDTLAADRWSSRLRPPRHRTPTPSW